ncbi:MAG: hypothetical protein LBO77_04745 [Desulfovibrio sp.]|jgi:hypothetical protein|nr:hypothetical protein [Desulfovibrio sp.]
MKAIRFIANLQKAADVLLTGVLQVYFPPAATLALFLVLSGCAAVAAEDPARRAHMASSVSAQPSAARAVPPTARPAQASVRQTAAKGKRVGGLKQFSRHAVFMRRAPVSLPPAVLHTASRRDPAVSGSDAESDEGKTKALFSGGRLHITGSMPSHPESRMDAERSPLPGGRHTLSVQESGESPEMAMSLRLSPLATARFALNPQDDASPLYSPLVKENGLAATGLYLDLEMEKGVQVQIGGEVRSRSSDSLRSTGEEDAGASLGLRWDF